MSHIMRQPAAACTGVEPGMDARRAGGRRQIATRLADFRSQDGLIPICSWCRKVRNEAGVWIPVEQNLLEGAGEALTHGVCPECARKHFPRHRLAA